MKSAIISGCLAYRYRLTRGEGRLMPVVMLNPSTADAHEDDPTIRRLMGFAGRGFGMSEYNAKAVPPYDGIDVVNLYAFRSTDPKGLLETADPYGPDNRDTHHRFCEQYGDQVIVAWGANAAPAAVKRFMDVLRFYAGDNLASCLGVNKDGSPKHPLYLPYDCGLHPFHY